MWIVIAWGDVPFGPFTSEDEAIKYAKSIKEMKGFYKVRPLIGP